MRVLTGHASLRLICRPCRLVTALRDGCRLLVLLRLVLGLLVLRWLVLGLGLLILWLILGTRSLHWLSVRGLGLGRGWSVLPLGRFRRVVVDGRLRHWSWGSGLGLAGGVLLLRVAREHRGSDVGVP